MPQEQVPKRYFDDLLTYYKKRVNFLVDLKMEILQDLVGKAKKDRVQNLKESLKNNAI